MLKNKNSHFDFISNVEISNLNFNFDLMRWDRKKNQKMKLDSYIIYNFREVWTISVLVYTSSFYYRPLHLLFHLVPVIVTKWSNKTGFLVSQKRWLKVFFSFPLFFVFLSYSLVVMNVLYNFLRSIFKCSGMVSRFETKI